MGGALTSPVFVIVGVMCGLLGGTQTDVKC